MLTKEPMLIGAPAPTDRRKKGLMPWVVAYSSLLLLARPLRIPIYACPRITAEEYQLKASFLFHFAQLVDWPSVYADTAFVVSTLGDDPFHGELEEAMDGKAIGSRSFRVLHFKKPQEARGCQVLFISANKDHLPAIFRELENAPVLTVGETEDFIAKGGMIRFFYAGK